MSVEIWALDKVTAHWAVLNQDLLFAFEPADEEAEEPTADEPPTEEETFEEAFLATEDEEATLEEIAEEALLLLTAEETADELTAPETADCLEALIIELFDLASDSADAFELATAEEGAEEEVAEPNALLPILLDFVPIAEEDTGLDFSLTVFFSVLILTVGLVLFVLRLLSEFSAYLLAFQMQTPQIMRPIRRTPPAAVVTIMPKSSPLPSVEIKW